MLFDAHVHSAASPDSETPARDAIFAAQEKGLGVVFTEHVDFVTPVDKAGPGANDVPKLAKDFIADSSIYPGQYEAYKSENVSLGLEIGLTKAFAALNKQTAEEYEYDFILGSVHVVDGFDIYLDFCKQITYEDHYARYLQYALEVIEVSDFFDSLAHIDYISRVSPFDEKNVLYELYRKEYDAVLSLLARRGIALEINTARLDNPAARGNLFKVFKRFKELNGQYITIGSDAHIPQHIGRNFKEALRLAEEAGLTVVNFKARKKYTI